MLTGTSCTTANNTEVEFEDGISIAIRELLDEGQLNLIEDELMVPIHRGKNPPDIVAMLSGSNSSGVRITVLMKPTVLVRTNVPEEIEIQDQPFNNDTFSGSKIRT